MGRKLERQTHGGAPSARPERSAISQTALSDRQSLPVAVPRTASDSQDFTNVTKLVWRKVAVHPRYAAETDHRRLRAALQDDLTSLSYEDLARLSWAVASSLGAGKGVGDTSS